MSPKFWEYFLHLESDLLACARYVEFSEKNFGTYSNEFARIIVVACSEIDAIFGELCQFIDPSARTDTIKRYFPIVTQHFSAFTDAKVDLRRYRLTLQPWQDWQPDKSPAWWGEGHNKIKHDRTNNFERANLHYALQSVGALFITILHYHQKTSDGSVQVDFNRGTQLFTPAKAPTDLSGMYWNYGV